MENKSIMNPSKRPMPAFLQNMMNANDKVICTAKGNDVRRVSIAELLQERLRIPIFQRRYCWGKSQWETLLADALTVVDGMKEKHSLGRITCVKGDTVSGDGRLLVIDGQQRNTTCSLLLAAIRDVALAEHSQDASCEGLASRLDSFLFPDTLAFEAWLLQSKESRKISDGIALDFAALIPTYCDRASYFTALLPPCADAEESCAEWRRPWEAKSYFVGELRAFSPERLVRLAETVLHKLEWLFFPLEMNNGYKDGTEDLQIIFERLAIRDATFCRPSRDTEFMGMGAADFVRNLLLGSFQDEADAIDMYKRYWLPIEQMAAASSVRNRSSNIAEILECMIKRFLKSQPEKSEKPSKGAQLPIGGELYPQFRRWLTAALASDVSRADDESEDEALQRRTTTLLHRLHTFASDHFSDKGAELTACKQERLSTCGPGFNSSLRVSSRWRCSRCSFPNEASFSQCTACSLPRP